MNKIMLLGTLSTIIASFSLNAVTNGKPTMNDLRGAVAREVASMHQGQYNPVMYKLLKNMCYAAEDGRSLQKLIKGKAYLYRFQERQQSGGYRMQPRRIIF